MKSMNDDNNNEEEEGNDDNKEEKEMEDNDDNKKEERRWELVSLSAKRWRNLDLLYFIKHGQMYIFLQKLLAVFLAT